MKIIRVFNNNIVATITDDEKEAIAQGSGIGFRKKPGDSIDTSLIEKMFYIQSDHQRKFERLFDKTPIEYFQISEAIMEKAEEFLEVKLDNQVVLALTDHIFFAVKRNQEGVSIPNLMVDEIRAVYSKEYEVAYWALGIIERFTGVSLPEDEAGYITLHLFNASMDIDSAITTNIVVFTKGILSIINEVYGINLDRDSLESSRILTHLKFLALRIFKSEMSPLTEVEDMYDLLISKNSKLESCLHQIDEFVSGKFEYRLSKAEKVYLMVHLLKVV